MSLPPDAMVHNLDGVTLGELYRNQERMRSEVHAGVSDITNRLAGLVTRQEYDVTTKGQNRRLDELEDSKSWVSRTTVGAVILAAISVIVTALSGVHI